jgi:hypothetical protein
MQIKLTKVIEYYEVVIPEGEDDPGSYVVKREPMERLEVRYEIRLQSGTGYQNMMWQSRPFRNITKAIEKRVQEQQKRSVKRQARLLESSEI